MLFIYLLAAFLFVGPDIIFAMEQLTPSQEKSVTFEEQSLQTNRRRSVSSSNIPNRHSPYYVETMKNFKSNHIMYEYIRNKKKYTQNELPNDNSNDILTDNNQLESLSDAEIKLVNSENKTNAEDKNEKKLRLSKSLFQVNKQKTMEDTTNSEEIAQKDLILNPHKSIQQEIEKPKIISQKSKTSNKNIDRRAAVGNLKKTTMATTAITLTKIEKKPNAEVIERRSADFQYNQKFALSDSALITKSRPVKSPSSESEMPKKMEIEINYNKEFNKEASEAKQFKDAMTNHNYDEMRKLLQKNPEILTEKIGVFYSQPLILAFFEQLCRRGQHWQDDLAIWHEIREYTNKKINNKYILKDYADALIKIAQSAKMRKSEAVKYFYDDLIDNVNTYIGKKGAAYEEHKKRIKELKKFNREEKMTKLRCAFILNLSNTIELSEEMHKDLQKAHRLLFDPIFYDIVKRNKTSNPHLYSLAKEEINKLLESQKYLKRNSKIRTKIKNNGSLTKIEKEQELIKFDNLWPDLFDDPI